MKLADLGGWPGILNKLASGKHLSSAEAAAVLAEVLSGEATPAQLAAFIFGLRCKGETIEELTGLVEAMLEVAEVVPVQDALRDRLVDTCGTGGDHSGTINVSTIAALVVAGAGYPVCKHGGRAASSKTGSADLLEELGVAIEAGPNVVARCIEQVGIGFCFAPRYHPAMRHVIPTRRELGVRTAFNLLGPLANPARLRRQLVGVGDRAVAARLAGVLSASGAQRAWVVCGDDGLDELTLTTTSSIVEWDAGVGQIREWVLDPVKLGLSLCSPEALRGGDASENAITTKRLLDGEHGPQRDVVLLNAAAALVVAGAAQTLEETLVMAANSIDSGRAAQCLEGLVRLSNQAD